MTVQFPKIDHDHALINNQSLFELYKLNKVKK